MRLFERSCPAGWIYPCSLEDIAERLNRLPQEDLEGLWAVGLMPSTRKDANTNARYLPLDKPVIHLYSYPETLRFRLPARVKPADMEQGFLVEYEFGMTVAREGNRYVCVWERESLRHFVVEYVLLHEVGHHVYHRTRDRQRLPLRPLTTASEQFAEAYARRFRRSEGGGWPAPSTNERSGERPDGKV